MKITAIEIGKIAIPLKTPFITALRRVDVAEDLVVKVHTDERPHGLRQRTGDGRHHR